MEFGMWVVVAMAAVLFKSGYQILQSHYVNDQGALPLAQTVTLVSVIGIGALTAATVRTVPPLWTIGTSMLAGGFLATGLWAFAVALRDADLSIVSPFQQSIPVFTALIEPLVVVSLGYQPIVLVGAAVVALGGYVVLLEPRRPLAPFRNILSRGPALGILTAVLFGSAAVVTRVTTQAIPVQLYVTLEIGTAFLLLTLIRRKWPRLTKPNLITGVVYTANLGLSNLTISLVSASVAVITFRLSLLINLLVGIIIFGEKGFVYRLAGALIVLAGIALVVFG